MTVVEKTQFSYRVDIGCRLSSADYLLKGSILKVWWAFARHLEYLMEYLTQELFFGGCHDRKSMLHQISEGRVKTRYIFWPVKNAEYLTIFLCQRAKVLLIFWVDDYVLNRIANKITTHQLINKAYVIRSSRAYQGKIVVYELNQ